MFHDDPRVFGFGGQIAPVHVSRPPRVETEQKQDSLHPTMRLWSQVALAVRDQLHPPRRHRVLVMPVTTVPLRVEAWPGR